FFFSSRRRHTRSTRDWSSDVCSSDLDGAMLCPGFVDMHAHSALAPFDDPLLTPKILAGFTTEVICPDGLAPAPVRDWRARQAYLDRKSVVEGKGGGMGGGGSGAARER